MTAKSCGRVPRRTDSRGAQRAHALGASRWWCWLMAFGPVPADTGARLGKALGASGPSRACPVDGLQEIIQRWTGYGGSKPLCAQSHRCSRPRIKASARSISASVWDVTAPVQRNRRGRATALILRQIARLGRSAPSSGEISGRSADCARELETGTTTIRSSAAPVFSWSTDTTTAGRFLPGSPGRPAPRDTSHTSPRRGSLEAIGENCLPRAVLVSDIGVLSVRAAGC